MSSYVQPKSLQAARVNYVQADRQRIEQRFTVGSQYTAAENERFYALRCGYYSHTLQETNSDRS